MGPTGCGRTEVYRVLARAIATGCAAPTNPYLQANNKKKVRGGDGGRLPSLKESGAVAGAACACQKTWSRCLCLVQQQGSRRARGCGSKLSTDHACP